LNQIGVASYQRERRPDSLRRSFPDQVRALKAALAAERMAREMAEARASGAEATSSPPLESHHPAAFTGWLLLVVDSSGGDQCGSR